MPIKPRPPAAYVSQGFSVTSLAIVTFFMKVSSCRAFITSRHISLFSPLPSRAPLDDLMPKLTNVSRRRLCRRIYMIKPIHFSKAREGRRCLCRHTMRGAARRHFSRLLIDFAAELPLFRDGISWLRGQARDSAAGMMAVAARLVALIPP